MTYYRKLAEVVSNPTVIAALDLCAAAPGDWVALQDVKSKAERTQPQARADLAGLTMMVKRRFSRSNWPFEAQWEAGGPGQIYYSMNGEQAKMWMRWSKDQKQAVTAEGVPGSEE